MTDFTWKKVEDELPTDCGTSDEPRLLISGTDARVPDYRWFDLGSVEDVSNPHLGVTHWAHVPPVDDMDFVYSEEDGDLDPADLEKEDEPEEPKVQHIRKGNSVIAGQLRDIADSIERGHTRGLYLVHVDRHQRPDLIVMTERYGVDALIGVTELELFKLKFSIVLPDDTDG